MDVERVHRPAVVVADQFEVDGSAVLVAEDRAEVWMRCRCAEQNRCRERIPQPLVALGDRCELHDDVCPPTLWSDERGRVRLSLVEVGEHLSFGIAALARIAPQLPCPPDLFGGVEVDRQVEARP